MVPNVKQREIQSGSTFVVTCMFEHTAATGIEWKLPEYLALHKEVSSKWLNLFIGFNNIIRLIAAKQGKRASKYPEGSK